MALTVNSNKRDVYLNFWNRYSSQADNKAMMLNNNADELEEFDRFDILSSLPNYNGLDVVDIGAGIGRFTAEFAQKANHVTSSDFIESFVKKNEERNAHFKNITYKVSDAVNLSMEDNSVDMVFTNWLLMYLSDEESVQFLKNAIKWLRPNGFLHLRESCSEPSTGRSKTTMHSSSDQNPTHYRFSSVYIQILRNLRFQSDDGQWWRFDVQWASSVPTYIERQSNWRQVHWLAKKVSVTSPADGINIDDERLLRMFAVEWVNEQIAWDTVLDGEKNTWTDKIFERALASDGLGVVIPRGSTVLCYNPRQNGFHVHLNAHWLAAQYSWNVWSVETNPFFYRTSLTKANTIKDSRVRFGWNETLRSAIEQWKSSNNALFNGFLAVEMLSTVDKSDVKKLTSILMTGSELVLLEPFDDLRAFIAQHKAVLEDAFEVVSVVEVSDEANRGQLNYFTQMGIAEELPQKRWLLIRGRVF